MTTRPDPHSVLGVSPDATIEEIRLAYRHRMRALHPDQGGADDVAAHGEMAALSEAWRHLSSDPCGPVAQGTVHARVDEYAAGVDASGAAAEGCDGAVPTLLRPLLAIAVVLLLAWMALFLLIAFSQSG